MNTVGEPYSGKPNVRIDEGRPGEAVPNRAAYSTLDPAVAPSGVHAGQTRDQLLALGEHWQTTEMATRAAGRHRAEGCAVDGS